ncbi:hypothetical protein SAMN05216232_2090 [Virgibacillus subterraneus]|uniref:Uncharacterized protein n=1 Tax=Virgibacillus subterraneus TaxID=621109 RepID=A0A1H9EMM1_9BACI|nr:hypothetical protein [Virgibacillus subterraneus]SEQ26970.1 hypothetical protein SAMN05216232_2090 [Virgibacillus subterraneus]
MAIIKDMNQKVHGIDKRKFRNSIGDLADQLRLIEQKITMGTDNSIDINYKEQQKEINRVYSSVQKITESDNLLMSDYAPKAKKRLS